MNAAKQIDTWDLKFAGRRDTLPTVEVDTGDENSVFFACEAAIERILAAIASPERVTVYVYESPSINFRRQTNSIFFAVAGPEDLVRSIHAELSTIPGAGVRFGDYIAARSCIPSFHLQEGTVWRPVESDTWEAVDPNADPDEDD